MPHLITPTCPPRCANASSKPPTNSTPKPVGGSFPTVDAVRRAARVDMNAASAAMCELRRAQTAQAVPPTVAVLESVAQANGVALTALWA